MARIRTVKPEFFRHERLQDLEVAHPGKYPMFVFAGLFGHCDKEGRFEWRPKQLKLDILPFLSFDMTDTLEILEHAQQIVRYEVGGRVYGWIPTFTKHQSIGGKEAQTPVKHPEPPREVIEKLTGSDGEVPETAGREGKGKEGKGDSVGLKPDLKQLRVQAVEILQFLNTKAAKNYQPVAANIDLIVNLLKAGATPEDMRAVIAKKVREWNGREGMNEYLRPATLFGPKNFWSKYQGELAAK